VRIRHVSTFERSVPSPARQFLHFIHDRGIVFETNRYNRIAFTRFRDFRLAHFTPLPQILDMTDNIGFIAPPGAKSKRQAGKTVINSRPGYSTGAAQSAVNATGDFPFVKPT
jgi:hypothetical protein